MPDVSACAICGHTPNDKDYKWEWTVCDKRACSEGCVEEHSRTCCSSPCPGWHCSSCGSENITWEAWFYPQTGGVEVQDCTKTWCGDCEEETKWACDCDDRDSHRCKFTALVNGEVQRCTVPQENCEALYRPHVNNHRLAPLWEAST